MKIIIIFIILNFSFFTLLYFKKINAVKKQFLLEDLYSKWKRAREKREEFEIHVLDSWMSHGFDNPRYHRLLQIELGAYELYRINFEGDYYLAKIVEGGYRPWELYERLPYD